MSEPNRAWVFHQSTCASRFDYRREIWRQTVVLTPGLRHAFWWLVHNCVSHVLLGVWVSPLTVWFHDWTSQRLNLRKRLRASPYPAVIPSRWVWFWHNAVVHTMIGVCPLPVTFDYHDRTASALGVEDWV